VSELRIGCSGWTYRDWRGPFYPEKLPLKRWLEFYAGQFDTTEINASFYHLPRETTVEGWREGAPPGFLFAWKVSRFITHNKKLKDCQESVDLVFGRMRPLAGKEGPALVQLPPMLKRNDERLGAFLKMLPRRGRHVFEFRHESWYDPAVFALLRDANAALCISDHHHAPAPSEVTADFVYWRGHGPGGRYHGRYGEARLKALAGEIGRWRKAGLDVYAYFDNDIKSAAPQDALALKELSEAP
jgi:uncharacterized protein YecE (DUF72 family)